MSAMTAIAPTVVTILLILMMIIPTNGSHIHASCTIKMGPLKTKHQDTLIFHVRISVTRREE